MPFLTERLRLRRLEPRDAVRLAEYRSDPSVAIYQSWFGMTLAEANAFISEQSCIASGQYDQWFQIAIIHRVSDQLIGDIGICVKSPGQIVEIGFTVASDAQGKGYGAEACGAAIRCLFADSAVVEIEAVVDARNVAAIKLAKRLGMQLARTEQSEFKGEICSEHRFVRRRGSEAAG